MKQLPWQEIVQRLNIIRHYILLGDTEGVVLEGEKLALYAFYGDIAMIIGCLNRQEWSSALVVIESFIKKHQTTHNHELILQKERLHYLEHHLTLATHEKTALEKQLANFHHAHMKALGWHISRILYLKKCLCSHDKAAYQHASQLEKTYLEQLAEASEEDEVHALKGVYRQVRQLHKPDMVTQQALTALSEAYEAHDLAQAKRILQALKAGEFGSTALTDEMVQLQVQIDDLTQQLATMTQAVDRIKHSDAYQLVATLDNWAQYFEEMRTQLADEIDWLEQCVATLPIQ